MNLSAQNHKLETDEVINLDLHFPQVGDSSILAIIRNNQALLNIEDVFNFSKIKYNNNIKDSALSGFFIHPDSTYTINLRTITYRGVATPITSGDIVYFENQLYLKSTYFNKVFNVNCQFNYNGFSVDISTKKDLPILIYKKQQEIRTNIGKLKNEMNVDTSIIDKYHLSNISIADWSINNVLNLNHRSETQVNFALGGSMAGGEANIGIQYNNNTNFDKRQQYYLWRLVNNNNLLLKQLSFGKISTNSIASVFAPIVGVKISNTPTNIKTGFGTYRLNRYTEPNWIVELYINNILVNYTKADPAGFYSFDVPIVYGNSQIVVKYYGPNGEQKSGEININIPYNFLPKHKSEYIVSAGIVQDTLSSRYTKSQLNYGVSNMLTIGMGVEYLSSITNRKDLPFISLNYKLTNNLLLTTQIVQDVKSSFTGNYRLPNNILVEGNFTKYTKGQTAIFNNYLEERNFTISFPWRLGKFKNYSRLNLYQIVLPNMKYTTIEGLVSGMLFGAYINASNYALLSQNNNAYLYTNLSVNYYTHTGISIMPMLQYEYNGNKLISARLQLEKIFTNKVYLNSYFENNFKSNIQSFNLGFRYDFNYLQAGVAYRTNSASYASVMSYFKGSILQDKVSHYKGYDNKPNLGRSGIVLFAFLDFNNNGIKDIDEPKVNGLKYSFPGGIKEIDPKDSLIVIRNLEPYYKYYLTIDKNSFDEIAWKMAITTIKVELKPNQFANIAIPITVVGEVSGKVYLADSVSKQPLNRLIVEIFDMNDHYIANTLTEEDGYFSYLGLKPGRYYLMPNNNQIKKLGYHLVNHKLSFEIKSLLRGDSQSGVDMILEK